MSLEIDEIKRFLRKNYNDIVKFSTEKLKKDIPFKIIEDENDIFICEDYLLKKDKGLIKTSGYNEIQKDWEKYIMNDKIMKKIDDFDLAIKRIENYVENNKIYTDNFEKYGKLSQEKFKNFWIYETLNYKFILEILGNKILIIDIEIKDYKL